MFKNMEKKIIGTVLAVAFVLLPLAGEAQTAPSFPSQPAQPLSGLSGQNPSLPVSDVVNLIDQISSKVVQGGQALQNLAGGTAGVSQTVTTQTVGSNADISGLVNLWNNINNWFTANVGTSLADVVKTVVNFMIYIWEIIIKLLQALVAHL